MLYSIEWTKLVVADSIYFNLSQTKLRALLHLEQALSGLSLCLKSNLGTCCKFETVVFVNTNRILNRLSQKVESADAIAAPYIAKSAPLVISAYDRCCKITSNPKVLSNIFLCHVTAPCPDFHGFLLDPIAVQTLEALDSTLRPIMPVRALSLMPASLTPSIP